jgi:hypothetical protein
MMESREAVLLVDFENFVNLVRTLPFSRRKLLGEKESHKIDKVHQVHNVVGNGAPLSQQCQLKTAL